MKSQETTETQSATIPNTSYTVPTITSSDDIIASEEEVVRLKMSNRTIKVK